MRGLFVGLTLQPHESPGGVFCDEWVTAFECVDQRTGVIHRAGIAEHHRCVSQQSARLCPLHR